MGTKICILGASFDTGNMGVSALATSSVKCLVETHPEVCIILLNYGDRDGFYELQLSDRIINLKLMNMSFSKRIWKSNHYLRQFFGAILYSILPWGKLRRWIAESNRYLRTILESDACFDISAGDSFSDIYGLYRLLYVSSCKLLVLFLGKRLVLLPQTYGPFQKSISRKIAKYILKRAYAVYSRDIPSAELVKGLLGVNSTVNGKVRVLPDIAFVMDALKPSSAKFAELESMLLGIKEEGSTIIGLNISGLLLNGGYTRENMFGLKVNYRELVKKIIDLFMQQEKVSVLLVPHVFVPYDNLESDEEANSRIYNEAGTRCNNRLICVIGRYNQNEIKYVIGMCDFFMGSRMHACIAALSQCIPAIGLAYSRKFYGVFETLGMGQYAIDMCKSRENDILDLVSKSFRERNVISKKLQNIIPNVQKQILETVGNCIEK